MRRHYFFSVVMLALAVVPIAALAQEKVPVVIRGWGEAIDPDGDCKLTAQDGKLTVTVPGGTVHDLSALNTKMNAPRVLQEVEGDFTIETRVSGEFDPGNEASIPGRVAFNSGGLLIMKDATNYLRLERNVWVTLDGLTVCYTPLLELWKEAKQLNEQSGTNVKVKPYFVGRSTHLRLTRRGDKVAAAISHDGKEWIEIKELTAEFPKKVQVGIMAINTSKKDLTVEFDGLKVTRDSK